MYISVQNNTNAADLYWKYTFVYEKSSLEIDKIIKRLRRETILNFLFLVSSLYFVTTRGWFYKV